jgi:7-keto-8-aminopelargonate synthetase-like enzyme
LLAGSDGTILVDEGSHKSIREAAELAGARGAKIVPVRRSDVSDLERQLLRCDPHAPRVITVNGVYSMPGTLPDIAGYADLARMYDATLYIDDAHGIGVLGDHPGPKMPYGTGGGGVVRYFGLDYDHIVYVAGLSKAFSSLGAFVTCRSAAERSLFLSASTMIFSGPVPVASLATALSGLRINRRDGDALRQHVHRLTMRIIRGARAAGLVVENEIGFPALTVVIGGVEQVVEACNVAWEHGILFTPAAFPAMPLERGGLRLSVTAANTDEDVDTLLEALDDIASRVMARTSLTARS